MRHLVPRVTPSKANSSGRTDIQLFALMLACGALICALGWFFSSSPEEDRLSIEEVATSQNSPARLTEAVSADSVEAEQTSRASLEFVPASEEGEETELGTLTVQVTSARTGKPIADASVKCEAGDRTGTAVTDGEGLAQIQWPADLDAGISVEAAGHASTTRFPAPVGELHRFSLLESGSLRGHVAASEPGPLDNGQVRLWAVDERGFDEPHRYETTVEEDGGFEIAGIDPGEYMVTASATNLTNETRFGVQIRQGGETWAEFYLSQGTSIDVTVLQADGTPAVGIPVSFRPELSSVSRDLETAIGKQATTDEFGKCQLMHLPARRSLVSATTTLGSWRGETVFPNRDGEFEPIELTLPDLWNLNGTLVDTSDRPLGGRRVLFSYSSRYAPLEGLTNEAGEFRFDEAPSRSSGFLFFLDDIPPSGSLLDALIAVERVRSDRSGPIRVEALGRRTWRVAVVDEASAVEIEGATVSISSRTFDSIPEFSDPNWLTDAEGVASFEGPTNWRPSIRVEAEGYRTVRETVSPTENADGIDWRAELEGQSLHHFRFIDSIGQAVVNARLSLLQENNRPTYGSDPDEFGRFTLSARVDPDRELAVVSREWQLPTWGPRTLADQLLIGDSIELVPSEMLDPAVVLGEVLDGETGKALSNPQLRGSFGGPVEFNGSRFQVNRVASGDLRLRVSHRDYESRSVDGFALRPSETIDVGLVELFRTRTALFRVRDAAGELIQGAEIVLTPLPKRDGGTGTEYGDLTFQSRKNSRPVRVPAATWNLHIEHPGYRKLEQRVDFREKKQTTLSLPLEQAP